MAAVGWGFRSLSYLWRRRRSPSVAVVRVGVWVGSWCGCCNMNERETRVLAVLVWVWLDESWQLSRLCKIPSGYAVGYAHGGHAS